MASTLKRSLEDEPETEAKRIKTESLNISHFSDCVLLHILSYLSPYDVYCLSKTCQRFKYLTQDKQFWKKINLLDSPMCAKKFNFFFDNVNSSTDTILVCGISKKEKTLTFAQFIQMNKICDNLTILAIENQYINSDEIALKDFPGSLKELSLRGTHIYGWRSFLQCAHFKLTKLHTLILDLCKWLSEHSLMALSKLVSLENLSLCGCANLSDSVAYMSITAKFGFRRLLRIDARRTAIGDQFLKCFHCVRTLREVYLEAPGPSEQGRRRRARLHLLQLQRTPHALVFSATATQHNKNGSKPLKRPPRSVSPSAPPCLHSCAPCTLPTCSVLPTAGPTEPPAAEPEPTTSGAQFEIRANGQVVACSSQICEIRLFSAQGPTRGLRNEELIIEVAPDDEGGKESAEGAQGSNTEPESLYCDDVSDTELEDEDTPGVDTAALLDHEALQADVTDAGVQWFLSARPDPLDPAGQPSTLFRPPYPPGPRSQYTQSPPSPGRPSSPPAVAVGAGGARDLRVLIERLDGGGGVRVAREAAGLTRLRVLVARGYPRLTDAALRYLAPLRLELLDVTSTAVTPAGLARFQQLNPECRLLHQHQHQTV